VRTKLIWIVEQGCKNESDQGGRVRGCKNEANQDLQRERAISKLIRIEELEGGRTKLLREVDQETVRS
jgi:hypothetical protein